MSKKRKAAEWFIGAAVLPAAPAHGIGILRLASPVDGAIILFGG